MRSNRRFYTQKVTDPKSVEDALRKLVTAWESLPAGEYRGWTGCDKVNAWLHNQMTPAIRAARDVLGLPNQPPKEIDPNGEIQFHG